mgnify:CR=1 FL=1
MANAESYTPTERRRSAREPVSRPVLYSGMRGEGMLRPGQAVDISAGGIQIHTTEPELVGRHLELELHPEDGPSPGNVIMVTGEVTRVEPLAGGKVYAMGLRFLQHVPATEFTGARHRPATKEESENLASSIQRQLDAMAPAVRLEVSGAARKAAQKMSKKSGAPPKAPPTKERRSWKNIFLALLLFVLLPATIAPLAAAMIWGIHVFRWGPEKPDPTLPPARVQDEESDASEPNVLDRRLAQIESNGPSYYINRGSYLLVQGKNPAAIQAFKVALEKPELTPIERFLSQLGEAQALAGEGNTDEAIEILSAPFEEHEFIPEPWLTLKAAFLEGLYNQPESPASRAPLINAFTFQRQGEGLLDGVGGPEAAEAETSKVRVEVDTNRHLLTVLEDNAIKAVYPVGLGFDGQTPRGLFNITNKIKNPDWYNRGDVVKAGDPENALGSRWLGLSDDEGPTPYGIHGTTDAESIGENLSRGCIRMRPDDVEELFTYVDRGTPVHIKAW